MIKRSSKFPKAVAIGLIGIVGQISLAVPDCSGQVLLNRLQNDLTLPDQISQLDSIAPLVDSINSFDGSEPFSVAPQDEVWLIDGRESHCHPNDLSQLEAVRLNEMEWEPSSLQALLDAHTTDPDKATLIYVHGDRTNDYWAARRGTQFYQNVFGNSMEPRAGVRFVIWAWKSEKIQNRPFKDYPIKSCRARLVGQTLAAYLGKFPDRRMVLVGYSLGCQAWLDAIEQLSITDSQSSCDGQGYRVCLLAPALDGNYVSGHRRPTAGSTLVARADIFDNSADRALKCSRVLGSRSAKGGGASIQTLAQQGSLPLNQITLIDLRDAVGKTHAVVNYSSVPIFGCRLREMVEEACSVSPDKPSAEIVPVEIVPVEIAPVESPTFQIAR